MASFFGGIAIIAVIDKLIPDKDNPHKLRNITGLVPCSTREGVVCALPPENASPTSPSEDTPEKLRRMGLFTALAIGIHNFPEGLATFTATLTDPSLTYFFLYEKFTHIHRCFFIVKYI